MPTLILTFITALFYSSLSFAAMMPLTDDELGEAVGQAFLQIDRTSAGALDYTRFTFGMDIDVSLNADLIDLGRYERSDDPRNYQVGSSDIRISDFALGSINSNGSLNPFSIEDPFFELAFERGPDGRQDLVGVRLGFGSAYGKLSGNIQYLTGNLDVELYGKGSYLGPRISCAWYDVFCGGAKLLVSTTYANDDFSGSAELLDPTNAQRDPIRATHIGIPQGNSLSIPGGSQFDNFLVGLFTAGSDCKLLGVQSCYSLGIYRTLDVGNVQTGTPATGMFLSFQTKSISWIDNGLGTQTVRGAFLNIPNGGIRTSFEEAFNGTTRIQTKFVDPYYP